jgi:hypothetical protein
MDNASLRSHITHYDQSGLSCPKSQRGEMGEYSQYNIYYVVNVNKAVNIFRTLRKAINKFRTPINLNQMGFFMDLMPYGIT